MKPDRFGMMFYRGTRPGIPGVYNRVVRAWDKGLYSHVEVVFRGGMSASSSMEDKGVRFKRIDYDLERWDFVPLPPDMEDDAKAYFERHEGERYDLVGNLHFVVGFIPHSETRKFCSEAAAGSIGLIQEWRYTPNSLYPVALNLSRRYDLLAA